MERSDIAIIGAGVIGLAVAYLLSDTAREIIVIEKNPSFGQESSSRNSEVIHAGLYYLPGSLKAETCIKGRHLLYKFCSQYNIPHKRLGKLIIASGREETEKIKSTYENGLACGVRNLKCLHRGEVRKIEANVDAQLAIYSPDTGIVDSHSLMNFFYTIAKQRGTLFSFSTEVVDINKSKSLYEITVKEPQGEQFSFQSNIVINAAGLQSDTIAQMVGIDIDKYSYRLNYCKGQYFRISNPKKFSIQHLIYPPSTPISLGIHVTPDLGEGLRLGPDAHYVSSIDYTLNQDDASTFYNSVKEFLPALELQDLIPDTVGVRAKLQKETELFRDFVVQEEAEKGFSGFINLIGIESPGLTACLAIAERVKDFL